MFKGTAVSPGVAVGIAHRVNPVFGGSEVSLLSDPSESVLELERFDAAVEAAAIELNAIIQRVRQQVGDAEAEIFESHMQIVRDPSLRKRVHQNVQDKSYTAISALHAVLQDYARALALSDTEYFRERLADIQDALSRIGAHLTSATQPWDAPANHGEAVIVVAHEILPSLAMSLGDLPIAGIVTEVGGGTSHAAILSRSRGIPAVSAVNGIMNTVHSGDSIIVDGREGIVLLKPDPETSAAYRKVQRELFSLKDRLFENHDRAAVSSDGAHVELLANINNIADAQSAKTVGASGVGLYRTEYLFLTHQTVPDEEEQYQYYRHVVENAPNHTVTIRTLDVGGDKTVPYLGRRYEANPFMGWRSIRLASEHPRLFSQQIRAILRAGAHGKVSMLIPMITTLDEIRMVNKMVRDALDSLKSERLEYSEHVKVGVMIEVPAAAVCIDAFLRETDFISIGSNDLIQYLVAADRDNIKVSHLCDPLSPPIFKVLHSVITSCQRTGTAITICGEMAGQPKAFMVLFGMGLRRFSMSPAYIPMIKELLSLLSSAQAERFAHHVLQLKTGREINDYLRERLNEIGSHFENFEVS